MSSQITGGRVTFLRRVKTGEWEHKEASAEITFSVPEGDGASDQGTFDRAFDIAQGGVLQRLGLVAKLSVPVAVVAATQGSANGAGPTGAAPEVPADPPRTTRRASVKKPPTVISNITPEEIAAAKAAAAGREITEHPEDRQDPVQVEREEILANVDLVGDFSDDLLSPPVQEITDKALVEAIQARNIKVKNPVAIRALIGKYVAPPKTGRDIPQDQRAAFLLELEAIGAAS